MTVYCISTGSTVCMAAITPDHLLKTFYIRITFIYLFLFGCSLHHMKQPVSINHSMTWVQFPPCLLGVLGKNIFYFFLFFFFPFFGETVYALLGCNFFHSKPFLASQWLKVLLVCFILMPPTPTNLS